MPPETRNRNDVNSPTEQSTSETTDFYIGWQPTAPGSYSRHIKKALMLLAVAVIAISITLAVSQKKFSTATFEFGTLTELTGVYFDKPVPCIKVLNGKDIFGNLSMITIPIVGYGKFGATGIIQNIENEKKASLNNQEVVMRGTLLYHDGKALMQIDPSDNPVVKIGNAGDLSLPAIEKSLGDKILQGEIIDPKCYFGVMKPGEGKPHKDCAIRCISGGIPPVLHIKNEKGESTYLLLVDANGSRINEKVRDHVGEPVTITGKVVQFDDWLVLYVSEKEDIRSYSHLAPGFSNLETCAPLCLR